MTLFPDPTPDAPHAVGPAPAPAAPRLREANRTQVCLRPVDLEGLLPEDHRARLVWAYVEGLDLTPLYQPIQAVAGARVNRVQKVPGNGDRRLDFHTLSILFSGVRVNLRPAGPRMRH